MSVVLGNCKTIRLGALVGALLADPTPLGSCLLTGCARTLTCLSQAAWHRPAGLNLIQPVTGLATSQARCVEQVRGM